MGKLICDNISEIINDIVSDYEKGRPIDKQDVFGQPNRDMVKEIIYKLNHIVYAGYYVVNLFVLADGYNQSIRASYLFNTLDFSVSAYIFVESVNRFVVAFGYAWQQGVCLFNREAFFGVCLLQEHFCVGHKVGHFLVAGIEFVVA